MDTGTAPVSGYVALYAIYNPTAGTASILATNATSIVAPSVYGGGHMPSGYTASALISAWATTSATLFALGFQRDRDIGIIGGDAVVTSTTTGGATTAVSISFLVPQNAISIKGYMSISSNTAANVILALYESSANVGPQTLTGLSVADGVGIGSAFSDLKLSSPQTMYYGSEVSAGAASLEIILGGYTF